MNVSNALAKMLNIHGHSFHYSVIKYAHDLFLKNPHRLRFEAA